MTLSNSPLRLLVKSYANGMLDRDQYLHVRQQVLKRLSKQGGISQEDLQNFLKLYQDKSINETKSSYSLTDWLIVVLGLAAASALALIIFG